MAMLCMFIITLAIPNISFLSIYVLPFLLRFLGFLSFPKYLLKFSTTIPSIICLLLFSLINYFISFYVYNLVDYDNLDFRFFSQVTMVNTFFWTGLLLNFKKMPFGNFNFIFINIALFFGGILFSFLSIFKYAGSSFLALISLSLTERSVPSFWPGGPTNINGPSLDLYSYLGLSLISLLLVSLSILRGRVFASLKLEANKYLGIFFYATLVLASLLATYSSIGGGSRTAIVIVFVTLLISFLVAMIFDSSLKNSFDSKILSFTKYTLILFILFGLFFLLSEELQNLTNTFLELGIGVRLSERGVETDRYEAWKMVISQIGDFPNGGRKMTLPPGLTYVHNMWLDQLYDSGFVAFLFLIIFHVLQLPVLIKFFSLNLFPLLKVFVASTVITFLIAFTGTPIFQASDLFFGVSCFFLGSITRFTADQVNYKKQTRKN